MQAGSTVAAVQAAMALVAPGGLVSVLAYVGHAGALLQMLGIIRIGKQRSLLWRAWRACMGHLVICVFYDALDGHEHARSQPTQAAWRGTNAVQALGPGVAPEESNAVEQRLLVSPL